MRAHAFRVVLVFCFAAAAVGAAHAGDILLNSDFTDGKTHWQGGGQAPTNMGGKLIVNLDPKKWTVLYQHFTARATILKLTVVYTLSSDCSLLPPHVNEDGGVFTSNDLVDACGLHDDFSDLRVGSATIALAFDVSAGAMMGLDPIHPTSTTSGSYIVYGNSAQAPAPTSRHTFSDTLNRYWGQFDNDEFCLAFPPGEGTVTLLKVELTKVGN